MALVYDGPVTPDDLTTFVREVPQPANFNLNQWIPDSYIQNNRVDIGRITRMNRMAKFRAYDANLPANVRDQAIVQQMGLPALSDSLSMGEAERMRLEGMRFNNPNAEAFEEAIYDDAQQLTNNIHHRMEYARGQVLSTGKFSLTDEGGLTLTADYGVPAANFVTPGTLWSDHVNSQPLSDITGWVTQYINGGGTAVNGNGFAPAGMIVSRQTVIHLLSNQSIRTAAGTLLGAAAFLNRDQLNASLASHELPPIVGVYDTTVIDSTGAVQRVIPEGKVIFLPPEGTPFARTVWGVSATALEIIQNPSTQMQFGDGAGIVGAVNKADAPPFSQTAFVDAVGMPVIDNPYALMVATVA